MNEIGLCKVYLKYKYKLQLIMTHLQYTEKD